MCRKKIPCILTVSCATSNSDRPLPLDGRSQGKKKWAEGSPNGVQHKKLTCDLVWELGGYTKWNMTWSPGSHLFSWHLGWLESLNWWQGTRISTQWGECTCEWGWGRGSRLWGCRISWTKWHHEWLFELTRRHSWCHLVQVILHPQRQEPHPQLPFTGALPSLGLNPYALPPLQGFEPS